MGLSAAHWVYLAGVLVIIAVMIMRKNVVVPAVAATFLTAWVFTGNLANALTSVFNASLTAAAELFNIFLIIALVTALLGSLRALDADKRMVKPFQKVMRNGSMSFLLLFLTTYLISLFFWPTPAVPLIAAILLPAAIRAGLPAMGGAMAIAIGGQGMALSSDYIIQVAPNLSATAAGVSTGVVADRALVMSLIAGGIAIVVAFLQIRKRIVRPDPRLIDEWENTAQEGSVMTEASGEEVVTDEVSDKQAAAELTTESSKDTGVSRSGGDDSVPTSGRHGAPSMERHPTNGEPMMSCPAVKRSKTFAVLVPGAFAVLVGYMMLGKFTNLVPETSGDDAAGLVGGAAALLLLAASITLDGREALQTCATHVVDGLVFAFKAMGVVLPIAGFFFIGNSEFAAPIMSLESEADAPALLFDLVAAVQGGIPDLTVVMGLGMLLVGMATGLDGSGFSGLPLTGSLSGTLGPASGIDPETLAAVGQMGSIWVGGGTLIAWSSLLAVAGFSRVPVLELVRKLFLPVISGLVVATVAGVLIF